MISVLHRPDVEGGNMLRDATALSWQAVYPATMRRAGTAQRQHENAKQERGNGLDPGLAPGLFLPGCQGP